MQENALFVIAIFFCSQLWLRLENTLAWHSKLWIDFALDRVARETKQKNPERYNSKDKNL